MNDSIDQLLATLKAAGSLLAVQPQDSFHVVDIDGESKIPSFVPAAVMKHADQWRLLHAPPGHLLSERR